MKKTPEILSKNSFTRLLLSWNQSSNHRQMPWKGEKDPYKIWLSEIILQQTRVEQGLRYYENFIRHFPRIGDLARAAEEKVFKLWEGLGYYSRCRNLIHTARFIQQELGGRFPDTYEGILSLKGVGPYTAAAIASFAYQLPHAVVDGNVYRVLARVFGIKTPTDGPEGKKYFSTLAAALLDPKQPGTYNQAIMDFGATICKPAAPLCGECPFRKKCIAFLKNDPNGYPVKEKKITIRKRNFCFLVIEYRGRYAIRQRTGNDIWRGLFEFPSIESPAEMNEKKILQEVHRAKWIQPGTYTTGGFSNRYQQLLTHQQINARFLLLRLQKKSAVPGCQWVLPEELNNYAFPRLFREFNQTFISR